MGEWGGGMAVIRAGDFLGLIQYLKVTEQTMEKSCYCQNIFQSQKFRQWHFPISICPH